MKVKCVSGRIKRRAPPVLHENGLPPESFDYILVNDGVRRRVANDSWRVQRAVEDQVYDNSILVDRILNGMRIAIYVAAYYSINAVVAPLVVDLTDRAIRHGVFDAFF